MRPEDVKWFHSFELDDGETIAGIKSHAQLMGEADTIFAFPLEGKAVLDVGAWDGFFSYEAEKRGAASVLATDHFCWSGPGWGTKAGFDYIGKKTRSKVKSQDVDVFALDPAKLGTYDMSLFLGVLYHLPDPFGGLRAVAAMTKEVMVVETVTALNSFPEPVMRYFLGDELNGDGTNYWAPNQKCLENMLRECGFTRFQFTPEKHHPSEQYSRSIVHAWR